MANAGDIEFNSDGNDIKFENLQRISAADSPVKYVFYKHDAATGTDAVDNGFEAGQIHKCTVFHNVLPRVKPASVATVTTASFCCIGFGVRKTGNDGTIEQYDVCEKSSAEQQDLCVMKSKTLQRRLLADCAAVNSE